MAPPSSSSGSSWASPRGRALSVAGATREFVRVVGGGLLVGGIVGMAASQVIRRVDEAMIEITLTTLAAYGSFVAAEHLHVSGVIATVTAGMLCGNYAAKSGMSPSTRMAVETFWEYLAFALNSLVFLLIGFEVEISAVIAVWKPILVAFVALTLGRAVVIACVSAALGRSRERVPWSWAAVLTWGGLRGALSMVLALSLAKDFPHRDVLVSLTFGVVIVSIFAQGLTMAPLLRWLGVVRAVTDRRGYDLRRGQMFAVKAALDRLDEVARSPCRGSSGSGHGQTGIRGPAPFRGRRDGRCYEEHAGLHDEALARFKRYLASVERNAIGRPSEIILAETERHALTLIGRDANFRFETSSEDRATREKILRHATHPILLIPERTAASCVLGSTVLVAYDGGAAAKRALASFAASGLAESRNIHVATVDDDGARAWETANLAVESLRASGIPATPHSIVSTLSNAEALAKLCEDIGAGMVVMGAFARSRMEELFGGSTTRALVEHSPTPLYLQH